MARDPKCECPVVWHGILPPPCSVHNPATPAYTYTARTVCEFCGAVLGDAAVHARWHEAQELVQRNADGGPRP